MKLRARLKRVWLFVLPTLIACGMSASALPPAAHVYAAELPPPEQQGITEDTNEEYIASYVEVTRNEYSVLYVDRTHGWIALQNIESGHIWYSVPNDSQLDEYTVGIQRTDVRSDMLIEYLPADAEVSATATLTMNSHIGCVCEGGISVTDISGGVRVEYYFKELDIRIPVNYSLKGSYFEAEIDIAGIQISPDMLLISITVLPSFGAGNWEANGYLFVPDGSGALISFNGGTAGRNSYEALMYGDELADPPKTMTSITQTARLPVFGTVSGGEALMGIVANGDAAASITAYKGCDELGYSFVSAKANFRHFSQTVLYENNLANSSTVARVSRTPNELSEFRVLYTMLTGEKATYTGMAEVYRDYLIADKGLKKQPKPPALVVDVQGAAEIQASFLGIPYRKTKALTTYAQTLSQVHELIDNGAENVALRLSGWTNDGIINDKYPQKAEPLSALGGSKGLSYLSEGLAALGVDWYPDIDLIRYQSGGNGVSKNGDTALTVFGEAARQNWYMRSVYVSNTEMPTMRLLTPQSIQDLAARFLSSYKKLGTTGVGLSTLGSTLYSSLAPKKGYYRSDVPEIMEKTIANYRDSGLSIILESANAYAIPYADRILAAPSGSSGYDVTDREVPFYQIVLHGYINMTTAAAPESGDSRRLFLKAVETGSELLYIGMAENSAELLDTEYSYLYSTTFSLWKREAADRYKGIYGYLNTVYDQTITAHEQIGMGVVKTTYSNGVSVIVNYGRDPFTADGQTVGALDYIIEGAGD